MGHQDDLHQDRVPHTSYQTTRLFVPEYEEVDFIGTPELEIKVQCQHISTKFHGLCITLIFIFVY